MGRYADKRVVGQFVLALHSGANLGATLLVQ